jgi:hypothetical protein
MLHCSMRSKFSNDFFYFQQDFLALNFCSLDIWTKVVYLHTHFRKCKSSINKSVCFFKDAHEKQMLQLVKLLMCLIMYKQISVFKGCPRNTEVTTGQIIDIFNDA